MGSTMSSQEKEQTVTQQGGTVNGTQNTGESQGSFWDSLYGAISSFSGKSSAADRPETGAVDTVQSTTQRKPESYPSNNVQNSYSPFSGSKSSFGNNGAQSPPSPTEAVLAQAAAPRNGFGVKNPVDPATNIVDSSIPPAKPVDQGATKESSAVKTSYAPFAKKKDAPAAETKYSPFGWTPGSSSTTEATETPANIPNPAQGDQDNRNARGSTGSWSPEVPARAETTANDTGFSPFAQWLEQTGSNANASPATPAADSSTKQTASPTMPSQNGDNDPMSSSRQSRQRYFQPNNISAPRMDRDSAAADQSYSNQAATNTFGRARDFRRPDGYAPDRRTRYMNRAQEEMIDPTKSYSRTTDPNTQGGQEQYLDQKPTMSSPGVPSGNWFDANGSQRRRQQIGQSDSFYTDPYGTAGRASYDGTRTPAGNWFDNGKGGSDLLDQDWRWNKKN